MTAVGIIGCFGFGEKILGGQTAKTNTLADELIEKFSNAEIIKIDTLRWKNNPINLIINCIKVVANCRNIIILPASNGIRVIAPLILLLNIFFKRKIHYVVIGGWLAEMLDSERWLLFLLKKLDGIYVETNSMWKKLDALGMRNIYVVPNFKKIKILKKTEIIYNMQSPYKFCTFSRVVKEKGIEDAIAAIKAVNHEHNPFICQLDIYGKIDPSYKSEFEKVMEESPSFINYMGEVAFDKSVEVLKDYHALLFPTYYFGEGFAGTIIDAFSSGIPVIASDWKYNAEIIEDGKTGFIFNANDIEGLTQCILKIMKNQDQYKKMRFNCAEKAKNFLPKNALEKLLNKLE